MIWICRKRWRPFRISPTKWHSAEFPSKPFNSGKKVSNILFRFRTTFEMFLFSSCELSFWHEFKRLCLCRRLLSHHANTFENKITFFLSKSKILNFLIFYWFIVDKSVSMDLGIREMHNWSMFNCLLFAFSLLHGFKARKSFYLHTLYMRNWTLIENRKSIK